MNISLAIYRLLDSLNRITPLQKASHPQYGSNRVSLASASSSLGSCKKKRSGRQDVAGEAAALAQQMVFALGERSNMGAILPSIVTILSGASLEHIGSGQPQIEIAGLYLCLLKILYGRIHQMVCTFIAQGLILEAEVECLHLGAWI